MGRIDLDGKKLKPNNTIQRGGWRAAPDEALSQFSIVSVTGVNSAGNMTVAKASGASVIGSTSTLYLCKFACLASSTDATMVVAETGFITGFDTSAGAVGDKVYLSSGGAASLTASSRVIGTIIKVHASQGVILFDGRLRGYGMRAGTAVVASGTATATVSVGTAFNGKPVIATRNETDGTDTIYVVKAIIAAGTLTITLNGVTDGDRDIGYLILS